MKSFRSFIMGKCRIPDKKVPFYMHWVSLYHAFNSGCSAANSDQVKFFLKTLSRKQEEKEPLKGAAEAAPPQLGILLVPGRPGLEGRISRPSLTYRLPGCVPSDGLTRSGAAVYTDYQGFRHNSPLELQG